MLKWDYNENISEQQRVRGCVHVPRAEGPVWAGGVSRPVRLRLSHLQQHRTPGPHRQALPLQPRAAQETDRAGRDLESVQRDKAGREASEQPAASLQQLPVQHQALPHHAPLPLSAILLPADVAKLLGILLLPTLLAWLQLLLQSYQDPARPRSGRQLHPHGESHQAPSVLQLGFNVNLWPSVRVNFVLFCYSKCLITAPLNTIQGLSGDKKFEQGLSSNNRWLTGKLWGNFKQIF